MSSYPASCPASGGVTMPLPCTGGWASPRPASEPAVIRVAGKVEESIVDGPGLRFVLFVQGCPHACPGCHNPETHDPRGGVVVATEAIEQAIRRNPLLGGVTLSGGEPFSQATALTPLAARLRAAGYHMMAYSGFVFDYLTSRPSCRSLLEQLDLLVDGPYLEARRAPELRFRGSDNQRIIDVPRSLRSGKPELAIL